MRKQDRTEIQFRLRKWWRKFVIRHELSRSRHDSTISTLAGITVAWAIFQLESKRPSCMDDRGAGRQPSASNDDA